MKSNQNIVICLKDIIKSFGIDVFAQHSKVNAIISDKMPGTDKAKDRYLLKLAIDHGFVTELSKTKANDLNKVCNKQKRILIDDNSIADDRAEEVIIWICQALDLKNPAFYQSSIGTSNTTHSSPAVNVPSVQTGSATPNLTPNNYGINTSNNPHRVKMRLSRGMIALIITCISVVVVAAGVFGIVTAVQNSKINAVETLIADLPDDENYYLDYQAEIVDAYAAYMELDEKLREKVENADKLLTVMDGLKVAEAYEQRQNMQFTKLESGGYSVKLKEGANSKINGELIIPGVYRQEQVVSIEDYAFENCRSITSVVVPDSITTIGVGAFKGCNNIQSMTLPFTGKSDSASAYEAVLGYVFGYETTQKYSNVYNTNDAFINYQHGNVENAVWQYTRIGYGNYSDGYQSFYYYIPSSIKKVTITNQAAVKDGAFNGCDRIENIIYTQAIESVGSASFQNCKSLLYFNSDKQGTINLAGIFDTIGDYAFANCAKISQLEMTDNVKVIGNHAFDGCKSIANLQFTSYVTYIGDYAFKDLKLIDSLHIYESTTIIGMGSFQGCNKLATLTLPFTGRSVDAGAYDAVFGYIFGYETTKKYSNIYNTNDNYINHQHGNVEGAVWQYTRIGYGNYSDGYQSFFYYIPTSVKEVVVTNQSQIKNAAFNGCKYIEKITYNQPLEYLGNSAFQNCQALLQFNSDESGTLNIEGASLSVGDCAFKNCEKIETIKLSNGIVSVGEYAFENTGITEMKFPNSVQTIKIGALKSCNKLKTLEVPFVGKGRDASAYEAVLGFIFGYETTKKYSNIYNTNDAFINHQHSDIDGLTWQYTRIGYGNYSDGWQSFFYHIPVVLEHVVITDQSKVPTAAFNGCAMLKSIEFRKGISSQGEAAFQNCSAEIVE